MRTTGLFLACFVGLAAAPASLHAQDAGVPARLSLSDALRIAERQHPAVGAALGRVAAADASVVTARQRPNPTLSYSTEGYRPWVSGSVNDQESVIEIAQELETGGRRRLRGEAAAAAAAGSKASLEETLRRARLEVAVSYFQLVLARSELERAKASLSEMDRVVSVNRARYQQGEISGGEFRRLEVERMRFTDDVVNADLSERHSRSTLLSLLGAPRLDSPLEPTDGLAIPSGPGPAVPGAPQPAAVGDAASLTARALSDRPDLAAARREVDRARAEASLQHALRLPNLTIGAGFRRDFGDNGLVVTLGVPLPLFDRNAGNIARAEAERRTAEAESRRVERAVSLDVQQALDALAAARIRLVSLESDYLAKAREARDSALAAYRSGASDLLDYLDAQRAWRDVQRAHQRALFDVRLGLLQLDAAVGGQPGDQP